MTRALTLVAAAALAACSNPSPIEPGSSPSFEAAPSRPFAGTCTGRSTVLPPEPGQPANVVRRHIDLVCQFLHLGRTTGSVEDTATLTPTGPIITSTTTYTAANGDQLFVTFSGSGTLPVNGVVSYSGTETVTGGTGRFAGATGSFDRAGTVTIATATGEFEVNGTLSY